MKLIILRRLIRFIKLVIILYIKVCMYINVCVYVYVYKCVYVYTGVCVFVSVGFCVCWAQLRASEPGNRLTHPYCPAKTAWLRYLQARPARPLPAYIFPSTPG